MQKKRMFFKALWITTCVMVVLAMATSHSYAAMPEKAADMVLINGKVVTVDKDFSVKQAIAVKDGWIMVVGTNAEIQKFVGKNTQVMDLKGRVILPGINDSHIHMTSFAFNRPPFSIDLKYPTVKSMSDIKAAVAARVKELKPGEWIRGRGWNREYLEEFKTDKNWMPSKKDLDDVAPENPLAFTDWSGHDMWVNSKLLDLAKVTRETPDPEGGHIMKDASGEPTGILRELPAFNLVLNLSPPVKIDDIKQWINLGMKELNANGITSYTEMAGPGGDNGDGTKGTQVIEAYRQLFKEGKLSARVQIPLLYGKYGSVTYNDLVQGSQKYQFPTDVDPYWMRSSGVKIFADGIPPSKTAYMWDEYVGGSHGSLVIPGPTEQERYQELINMVIFAHEKGWQAGIHACGDRAISAFIDGVEQAIKKKPWMDARHYVIHADFITPKDTQRVAQYNMGVCSQPVIQNVIADDEPAIVGVERAAYEFPHKRILASGIPLSFSSDGPVTYPNWRSGVQAAILREGSKTGKVSGPEQRITREEALRAYTMGGAWQDHMESVKGSIEANKLADFCVISDDIMTVDERKIKDIKVLMTIVGGKVVYDASAE